MSVYNHFCSPRDHQVPGADGTSLSNTLLFAAVAIAALVFFKDLLIG